MANHEFTLEQATKVLSNNLLTNVEQAFYEELRPKLDLIAKNVSRNLARSLKGYIQHERNYNAFGEPLIILKFNSEDLTF